MPTYKIPRLGIGYIPQGRGIFPELTVWEDIKVTEIGVSHSDESLERILNYFPILKDRMKQIGGTLNGGEQQMLAIARVLVTNPKLVIMDEPIEGLMPSMVSLIESIVLNLKDQQMSILLVEQNLKVALRVCDRVYVMEKGGIKYESDVKQSSEDILIEKIGFKERKTRS